MFVELPFPSSMPLIGIGIAMPTGEKPNTYGKKTKLMVTLAIAFLS